MVTLKSEEEIVILEEGGKKLAIIRDRLQAVAQEGISLLSLDELARILMTQAGGRPAFLNYQPYGAEKAFPASICTSLNEVVVHGIPTKRVLKQGDVLKIDLGLLYKEWYTDTATMIVIGEPTPEVKRLMQVTKEALMLGIAALHPRNTLGDVGYMIGGHVTKAGFHVVKGLTGHGIGRELHEDPSVFNEGRPRTGIKLKAGMVLAIEVMTAIGTSEIIQKKDDSYVTADGSIAAHFEHTVVITKRGPRILTLA